MHYYDLTQVYDSLEKTTKRLEKTFYISELLRKTPKEDLKKVIYLLHGRVFPEWDAREIGMSSMLIIKSLVSITGENKEKIIKSWKKLGDLGLVAEELIKEKKQKTFFSEELTVKKVFEDLGKIASLEGQGTVSRKIALVSGLLNHARPLEARYIVRTVIGALRVGAQEGTIRDSIVWAYFPRVIGIFFKCDKCNKITPNTDKCIHCGAKIDNKFKLEQDKKYGKVLIVKDISDLKHLEKYDFIKAENEVLGREVHNLFLDKVQKAYDLSNDFAIVAEKLATKGIENLKEINVNIGSPINPMLAIKVNDVKEAFKAVGTPAEAEYKLDGFRVQIHRKDDNIYLFTRRLENVTKQFKELIPIIKANIKGKEYILDSEVVGYDKVKNKYLPFQYMSQRIKRKYDIEKIAKNIPVEINIFDVIYYEGKNLINETLEERRKLLEKIVKEERWTIVLTKKLISSSEKELEKFYKESLDKGNEGLMIKNFKGPYVPGRRVDGWVKLKPVKETLDLVIIGADWGEGKRSQWLSSFTLACRKDDKFVEIGKVGTGIKEKDSDITFLSLTKMLKPLIISEKSRNVQIKPRIVVEIDYEEIQESPTYSSGYALRFPRIKGIRYDMKASNASDINLVKLIYKKQKK